MSSAAALREYTESDTGIYRSPFLKEPSSFEKRVDLEAIADRSHSAEMFLDNTIKNTRTKIDGLNYEVPAMPLIKNPTKIKGQFKLLQSWEGLVVEVNQGTFVAIIKDKTNNSNPDERITLENEEVAPDDDNLVNVGAKFYWCIGYSDMPGKPRERVSRIRFQRIPEISTHEIKKSEARASEYATFFSRD